MTRLSHATKSVLPVDVAARALAEIGAEAWAAIAYRPSEAEIADAAAEAAEFLAEMRAAEADRRSQIEQPPAVAERKLRQPRRPSISTMIEQAEQAGKPLASVTLPDGTKLDFSKPEPAEMENPWPLDEFRTKETKQ